MSDRPVAETSTWQHTELTQNKNRTPAGFETAVPTNQRQQNFALDRAATVDSNPVTYLNKKRWLVFVIEMEFIHFEEGTYFWNTTDINFNLQGAKKKYS